MADNKDVEEAKVVEKPPFRGREAIGYAFGDVGNGFFFQLVSNYMLIYATDALGISPAIAGMIILVAKFVSAFTDFGFGRFSDQIKLRSDGRYHVFVRVLRYPLMISMILLFLPWVGSWPMALRIVWATAMYIAWVFFYSGVSAPYGSIASVSTPVVENRDKMAAARGFGSQAGGLIVGFILPLIMYQSVKGQQTLAGGRFFWVALIFAALAWICYQITLKLTVERIRVDKTKQERVPLHQILGSLFRNRAMIAIVITALTLILTQTLKNSVNAYLYKDVFNNNVALAFIALTGSTGLILAPFAPKITARFGKKWPCGLLTLFTGVMYGIMFFVKISDPWVFFGASLIANIGDGFFNLMIWSLITDIIDDEQVRTHTREDGTVYTGYMFARKIGQSLAGFLSGASVAWTGYVVASSGAHVTQAPDVLSKIYTVATAVPAIGYILIALVLLFLYPLSAQKVKENAEIIAARRAKNEL